MTEPLSPREIAASLGQPLWTSDFFMPKYRAGEFGRWRIHPGGQLINDWGYFTQTSLLEMLPSLSRKVDSAVDGIDEQWDLWMSLTPHEIESQQLGCVHASGHTAVMGLGMGWIAANVALNPQVTRVTVIERDAEVIQLFELSGALESVPEVARAKMQIVQADALLWCPDASLPVDFLLADIWLHLAQPDTLNQVRRMQEHIQASQIYYWGQEIGIYNAVQRLFAGTENLSNEMVRHAVQEVIRLPLLTEEPRDYAHMIEQVIRNRKLRMLPIETDVRG